MILRHMFPLTITPPKYGESWIVSAISNSIATGVIGTILLVAYAATRTRSGSLKKES